jgi:Rps23 Pro-64 3,4-dihydroxylase Tpa1-like proline 4-hydroxylase
MTEFLNNVDNRLDGVFLNDKDAGEFDNNGYCVIENFLGKEWSESLLGDCQVMKSKDALSQHYFKFGDVKFEKPHIFEIDLHDASTRNQSTELSYMFDVGGPHLLSCMDKQLPQLNLTSVPSAIKMQYNEGDGGCFPFHYDNPGPPSTRKLTCIIYLNPDWQSEDGGELVLLPFLSQPITIAPKMNTAVLFRSDLLLHRVNPSMSGRYCITIWCDGTNVNSNEDILLTKDKLQFSSYDHAAEFFQKSPLQRVLSRAVYSTEYATSLEQCVKGTRGHVPMMRQHEAGVLSIESKLRPLVEELRKRKHGDEDDNDDGCGRY